MNEKPSKGTPTDLRGDAVEEISSTLRRLVADVFALYVKTKNFHRHISGRRFRDCHLLLDEHSMQIFATRRAKNKRSIMLRKTIMMVVLISLIAGPLMAQEGKVTSLITKDLTEFSGKEGLMITVEYAPGGSDPVHRHDAHAFVYVLEGSIVMQVKGGKEVTLTPGQTFYEGPNDLHVVSRNASKTTPAKFLVFFVKDKAAPVLKPVK
ncbi:MAG TPA: cupin domain-containing protein [Pyrinomonadaceae bacterium]|nr:cupin domain-containing protein [Pyrinomonadaceae bacterium]